MGPMKEASKKQSNVSTVIKTELDAVDEEVKKLIVELEALKKAQTHLNGLLRS